MKTIPIYSYIYFGTALRYLQDVDGGYHIHGKGLVLHNIEKFFSGLNEFDLPVTLRASDKLAKYQKSISKATADARLTDEQAKELNRIMNEIRSTLDAESGGHEAFIVTDKRLRIDKLLSDVGGLMNPITYSHLPGVAKYDFDEAGKCIAFNRATAAAFHLLRGTESVLREYYCFRVKRGRISKLLWGPIVTDLKTKKRPNLALLGVLDNIREHDRNPTNHPEKIFDIDEAQDLFALCIDVVNRMIKEIHP